MLPLSPAPEVNVITRPDRCWRNTVVAGLMIAKWPFRCVWMTASHSSSAMLNTIRSRNIPAGVAAMSSLPNVSSAFLTICSPPSIVATDS